MNKTEEETFEAAIRIGEVTHADPRCALSVAVVSALVRCLCRDELHTGTDIDGVLDRAWTYVVAAYPERHLERQEYDRHVHAESLSALILCDREMGYVYKCLGSALWCLREAMSGRETFKSAILKLVMCGGDADTNAAVAGALMGAYCGYDELPPEWADGLRHKEWFMEKIEALCVVAGLTDGTYDSQGDRDTDFDGGRGFLSEEEMKRREMQLMERILSADRRRGDKNEEKPKKKTWKFWQ
jgi:ADP-ribosylglycohydrolase